MSAFIRENVKGYVEFRVIGNESDEIQIQVGNIIRKSLP